VTYAVKVPLVSSGNMSKLTLRATASYTGKGGTTICPSLFEPTPSCRTLPLLGVAAYRLRRRWRQF
jgi:hypothetical protein